MSEILFDDGDLTTTWHPAERVVCVKSYRYRSSEALRAAINAGIAAVGRYRAKGWISDTSELTGAMKKEDNQWVAEDAVPRGVAAGLQAVITITPASAIARLSNKKVNEVVAAGGLVVGEVADWDEAISVVRQITAKAA